MIASGRGHTVFQRSPVLNYTLSLAESSGWVMDLVAEGYVLLVASGSRSSRSVIGRERLPILTPVAA